MAVQQDRGSSPIELWDSGSGQLLATIDDPFVVRQVNFAFTGSGLVLHTDYGAMSIYSCSPDGGHSDCALLAGELASKLLAAQREQDLQELAAEIAPDWDLHRRGGAKRA